MSIKVPKGKLPKKYPEDGFLQGQGQNEREIEPFFEQPLNSPLFMLTDVGAVHWLAIDGWSLREAALLLCGANPARIDVLGRDPNVCRPDFESCGYPGVFERISRASELGLLSFPESPFNVCQWAAKKHDIPAPLRPALAPVQLTCPQETEKLHTTLPPVKTVYSLLLFERLQPSSEWRGGRTTESDVLTLEEAARMASKHSGAEVAVSDFLRAAARGEIRMFAIIHNSAKVRKHSGGAYLNEGMKNEDIAPAESIAPLSLSACKQLAAVGRATWRTFDGFSTIGGKLMSFTEASLTDDEPDFNTVPSDCRVWGRDMHALADAYSAERREIPDESIEILTARTVTAQSELDPVRRLARLRELGGRATYKRGEWRFSGITVLEAAEKEDGRKRSDQKTIRADLKEAAQAEHDKNRAGFGDGLGQR